MVVKISAKTQKTLTEYISFKLSINVFKNTAERNILCSQEKVDFRGKAESINSFSEVNREAPTLESVFSRWFWGTGGNTTERGFLRDLIQWKIITRTQLEILGSYREITISEIIHLLHAVMSCCLVSLDSYVEWRLEEWKAENPTIFEDIR